MWPENRCTLRVPQIVSFSTPPAFPTVPPSDTNPRTTPPREGAFNHQSLSLLVAVKLHTFCGRGVYCLRPRASGMVPEQRKNSAAATPASTTSSPRVVLHVDLDAFFVQVERKLNPTLIGMCSVVCWLSVCCSCMQLRFLGPCFSTNFNSRRAVGALLSLLAAR